MFSSIIDPYTKTKVSLFGQEGGKLLENYIKAYKNIRQMGGKSEKVGKIKTKKNKQNKKPSNNQLKESYDLATAIII
jgi:hypothetical protein